MANVKATREGLPGQKTSSGYLIDGHVPFVALPSIKALRKAVHILNPANGKSVIAMVLDVGPHSDSDDAYVFGGARPLAERGISVAGGVTGVAHNGAGIDLGGYVWDALGMADNTNVEWEFLETQAYGLGKYDPSVFTKRKLDVLSAPGRGARPAFPDPRVAPALEA